MYLFYLFFSIKSWKTSAVSTTVWMVETQIIYIFRACVFCRLWHLLGYPNASDWTPSSQWDSTCWKPLHLKLSAASRNGTSVAAAVLLLPRVVLEVRLRFASLVWYCGGIFWQMKRQSSFFIGLFGGLFRSVRKYKATLCFPPIRVFAIRQIPLGWKAYRCYHETDELPNPRPTQPKGKLGWTWSWATFSHSKTLFRGLGLILYWK